MDTINNPYIKIAVDRLTASLTRDMAYMAIEMI